MQQYFWKNYKWIDLYILYHKVSLNSEKETWF